MSTQVVDLDQDAADRADYEKRSKKLINRASRIANLAHAGQTRKYSGLDYIMHPIAVASIVSQLEFVAASDHGYVYSAAAYLHDVIEDTKTSAEDLRAGLDGAGTAEEIDEVVKLVVQLTNVSIQDEHKSKPRADRKALDLEHIKGACKEAQAIKLADRLHNLSDVAQTLQQTALPGAKFERISASYARKYLGETYALLQAIGPAEPTLARNIRSLLLSVSNVAKYRFEGEDASVEGPLGVFAAAVAVTKYKLTCPSCGLPFELSAGTGTSIEGRELGCPDCGHRAIFTLLNADH